MKIHGDHLLVCDLCGMQVWRSQARKRWDGLMVCEQDYEVRHIADRVPPFIKGEGRGVKDARPETENPTYTRVITASSNYNTNKVWGTDDNTIWGGLGDPSVWGE